MRSHSSLLFLACLAPLAHGLLAAAPYARQQPGLSASSSQPQPAAFSVATALPSLRQTQTPTFARRVSKPPVLALRGGLSSIAGLALPGNADAAFNLVFGVLSVACASLVVTTREKRDSSEAPVPKPVRGLQWRFLIVFWLFKMADWLQGPYFYEVYASKIINGVAVSSAGVARLFLTGFGTTALLGAVMGGLVDGFGRKKGSLAFALMYSLSALSTRCETMKWLFAGRVAGGLGTSLLFSAPEAWLVSEHQKNKFDGKYLGQTFGLAYLGDAIVAIVAGQLAGLAASRRGPVAPFELSVLFLVAGAAVVTACWKENFGGKVEESAPAEESAGAIEAGGADEAGEGAAAEVASGSGGDGGGDSLIVQAAKAMLDDKKIMLVGAVQALFEGAMYIFVLQWPPAIKAALGAGVAVPFGKIFSCFMVCCMLGSTTFSALTRQGKAAESVMLGMLVLATTAMTAATTLGLGGTIASLVGAFFAFEACVGMYFPLIGTLRSKYLPDAYRGVIMNLFGIPLNLIVVGVFLSISKLGLTGAFTCSTIALAGATVAQFLLRRLTAGEEATASSS